MLLYFVGPKHPSGICYISCFLTDRTALNWVIRNECKYNILSLFYNILSAGHYSDVMNSLLNAFRLKKIYILYFILFSGQIRWQVGSGNLCFEKWNRFPPIFCGHSGFQYSGDKTRGKYFLNQQILEMRREFVGPQTLFAWDLHS